MELELSFSPFPTLTTNRLILRQLRGDDDNEIMVLRSDKRILEFLTMPKCSDRGEAKQFIEKINNVVNNNESIYWGVARKDVDVLIGTVCIWNISKENSRAEIGYVLHPDFHGKGFMSEAIDAALDYGFAWMKLHSIEANVHPDNTPSIKLVQTKGFVKEAHLKENVFFDGKFLDTAIYSLLNKKKAVL